MKTFFVKVLTYISIMLYCTSSLWAQPDYPVWPVTPNPNNPILAPAPSSWDENIVFLPHIFYDSETYYLCYTGFDSDINQAIGLATSSDGFDFIKLPEPILEADGIGFDAIGVTQGVITKLSENNYVMFYNSRSEVGPGPGPYVGMATSISPEGPWDQPDFPIFSCPPIGEWNCGFISPCSILKIDTSLYLYYYATNELGMTGPWQIGLAISHDEGLSWEIYDDPSTEDPPYQFTDPVLKINESGQWDDVAILGCSVIEIDTGGYGMFYIAKSTNGAIHSGLGYATSHDGIYWKKDYDNEIFTNFDDPAAYGIIEMPTVVLNEEMSQYYLYYDYGITDQMTGPGIGMAMLDNIVNVNERPELKSKDLNIYPNPTQNQITVRSAVLEDRSTIYIYDIFGRVIDEQSSPLNTLEVILDVSDFPSGVYMVVVKGDKQITAQGKFVIR